MEKTFEFKNEKTGTTYTIQIFNDGGIVACENSPGGKIMGGLDSPIFERVLDNVAVGNPGVYEDIYWYAKGKPGWVAEYVMAYCMGKIMCRSG